MKPSHGICYNGKKKNSFQQLTCGKFKQKKLSLNSKGHNSKYLLLRQNWNFDMYELAFIILKIYARFSFIFVLLNINLLNM